MLTVNFQKPPGNVVSTRRFEPGDQVRVGGRSTGDFGLPNSFMPVTLDMHDGFNPIYLQSRTNHWGSFWFDVTLPNVKSEATVLVSVNYIVGGWERMEIPIGIGVTPPDMPSPPPGPMDWVKWVAIALIAYGVIRYLPKPKKGAATDKEGG